MPKFETPEPIQAFIDVSGVSLTVNAVEGATVTTVDITPHNPDRSSDVQHAQRATIELTGNRLNIQSPRDTKSRLRSLFGAGPRADLVLGLPAGSQLEVRGWGDVHTNGVLGSVDIDTGMGDLTLDQVAGLRGKTGLGEIRVHSISGPAELRTSTGSVVVGRAAAELSVKTPVGDVNVDEGVGGMQLTTSTGNVTVRRAQAGVFARTPAGDVRLHSVCTGVVDAKTSYGQIEIGVAHGSAAWLDLSTRYGTVRSDLQSSEGPGDAELAVQIQAVTSYGDIVLRRA
jgi:hypothetical protein